MRIDSIIRPCAVLLFSMLLPLLLSGCIQEFFGLAKSTPPTEAERIALPEESINEGTREPDRAVSDRRLPEQFPSPDERTAAEQINPQTPESLFPPTPPGSPETSGAPQPLSLRREATARPADFSYRDVMLTEDTAWHGEVLIEGGVTIAPQATLTVQSGTIVRFKGGADAGNRAVLVIQGRIVVNGAADRPVIFRSLYENAQTGDWQGIVLLASGKKNLIQNCRVEGAETGFDASFSTVTLKNAFFNKCRTGARLQDCVAVVSGGGAGECGTGTILYDSEADIRSADFSGNRMGIFAARTSLSLAGSRLTGNNSFALSAEKCRLDIAGNRFSGNGGGLVLSGCEGTVSANRIAENAANGLVLTQSRVKVRGNEIERNAKAGLRVDDGKGIAWGNAMFANGDYDLYNAGADEFRAIGNWWGGGSVNVAGRIYDRGANETRGRVLYMPVLQARPVLDVP